MKRLVVMRLLHAVAILIVLAFATLWPRVAMATIIAGGTISNATWTAAGNPYVVQGDIRIPNGSSLTIEAGTVVQFPSGDAQNGGLDATKTEIIVQGSLNVNGTAANSVTFSA